VQDRQRLDAREENFFCKVLGVTLNFDITRDMTLGNTPEDVVTGHTERKFYRSAKSRFFSLECISAAFAYDELFRKRKNCNTRARKWNV
jgi:hypothetical protein